MMRYSAFNTNYKGIFFTNYSRTVLGVNQALHAIFNIQNSHYLLKYSLYYNYRLKKFNNVVVWNILIQRKWKVTDRERKSKRKWKKIKIEVKAN